MSRRNTKGKAVTNKKVRKSTAVSETESSSRILPPTKRIAARDSVSAARALVGYRVVFTYQKPDEDEPRERTGVLNRVTRRRTKAGKDFYYLTVSTVEEGEWVKKTFRLDRVGVLGR